MLSTTALLLVHAVLYCTLVFEASYFMITGCVAYAAADSSGNTAAGSDDLLAANAITASISRRLAFPDFRDDEKAGAITLLGSAEIDRGSGTINIPSTSKIGTHNISRTATAAMSTPGQSGKHNANLQLPASHWRNTAGRALYSFPFRMLDPASNTTASFHTTFSFQMRNSSSGAADKSTTGTADGGLTFLVVPDEVTVGRNGGWLGMMNDACDNTYRPFAVEFDTFKNEEFQDPNDHHVGINYGSIVSRQTADIDNAGVVLRDGTPARAWISYDSSKHLVDVRLAKDGSEKPVQPLLSMPLDLSDIFKEYMFVGFSGGASGKFSHSILSWHFSSDSTGLLRFPKAETCAKRLLPIIHTQRSKNPNAFIIFCLVMLIIVLAIINFACIPYKTRGDEVPNAVKLMRLAMEKPRPQHKPRKIPLYEILEASRFFNEGEVLGCGKSGTFYKGVLKDSSEVAIKRFSSSYLEQASNLSSNKKKLEKEINKLVHLHHPNLVPLRGWCLDKGEILLAYEYMPNGSLDQWLLSQASIFSWNRRYKIVKELAGALAFLHSSLEKPVVHRNVKLSNVLLDITFRPKLGDYGICNKSSQVSPMQSTNNSGKLALQKNILNCPKGASPMVKRCMPLPWDNMKEARNQGKHSDILDMKVTNLEMEDVPPSKREASHFFKGCMPQVLCETIKKGVTQMAKVITKEDDVYCYGLMLLEIVCGWVEGEEGELKEESLVDWVWSLKEEGRLIDAVDEDLRVGVSRYCTWEEEAICVLNTALLCTFQEPSLRPSMSLVTKYLHGETPLPKILLRKSIGRQHFASPLVIYPDPSPNHGASTCSPPLKVFNVGSPWELCCKRSSSSHVASPQHKQHCPTEA